MRVPSSIGGPLTVWMRAPTKAVGGGSSGCGSAEERGERRGRGSWGLRVGSGSPLIIGESPSPVAPSSPRGRRRDDELEPSEPARQGPVSDPIAPRAPAAARSSLPRGPFMLRVRNSISSGAGTGCDAERPDLREPSGREPAADVPAAPGARRGRCWGRGPGRTRPPWARARAPGGALSSGGTSGWTRTQSGACPRASASLPCPVSALPVDRCGPPRAGRGRRPRRRSPGPGAVPVPVPVPGGSAPSATSGQARAAPRGLTRPAQNSATSRERSATSKRKPLRTAANRAVMIPVQGSTSSQRPRESSASPAGGRSAPSGRSASRASLTARCSHARGLLWRRPFRTLARW